MQEQWTISRLDCDLWWKVGFIWQLLTTSSVISSRGSSKALLKAKPAPEKSHGHCSVICCPSDPLQVSESWISKRYIQLINEMHQKLQCLQLALVNTMGPTLHNKHPTTCCITNISKVEQIELWSFAYLPHSPHLYQLTATSSISTIFSWKCFHNQQKAKNAYQEFVESQSMDFYATEINKLLIGKNVLIIMAPTWINKHIFRLRYNDLKFTVQNCNCFFHQPNILVNFALDPLESLFGLMYFIRSKSNPFCYEVLSII